MPTYDEDAHAGRWVAWVEAVLQKGKREVERLTVMAPTKGEARGAVHDTYVKYRGSGYVRSFRVLTVIREGGSGE